MMMMMVMLTMTTILDDILMAIMKNQMNTTNDNDYKEK